MAIKDPKFGFKDLMKNLNMQNTFRFLGENEDSATLIACSIAVFKGIFRPLFTMMDKKTDPEAKKYAAIREGLTEVAALPIYAVTPYLVGKFVEKFYHGDGKKNVKINAKFAGICAATLIIPAVCNVIQPPVMNAYKKHQDAKKLKIAEATTPTEPSVKPVQTTFNGRINYGMKVGG